MIYRIEITFRCGVVKIINYTNQFDRDDQFEKIVNNSKTFKKLDDGLWIDTKEIIFATIS